MALVVGVVVIDIRVRRALLAHHRDEQARVDKLVVKLLSGTGRRPMGFVLRDGADEKRHRGDGMGGEVVWEPEAGDDAAAGTREASRAAEDTDVDGRACVHPVMLTLRPPVALSTSSSRSFLVLLSIARIFYGLPRGASRLVAVRAYLSGQPVAATAA